MDRKKLESFLEDLITPATDSEKELFRQDSIVDDYIGIKNRIPGMSEEELILEINNQLAPYKLKIENK